MSSVKVQKLSKSFENMVALRSTDLSIEQGEFVVIVGPSGCGKSTLLRLIAGLESPTEGSILIEGVDVTHLAPAERGLAMVFQSYALYPHLTVAENIAFPLRMAKRSSVEIRAKAAEVADLLELGALLNRRPRRGRRERRRRARLQRSRAAVPCRHARCFLLHRRRRHAVTGFYSGDLTPRIVRHDANLLGHFDVSEALKFSVEAKYARTDATTFDYYIGTYGTAIGLDNPFVPTSIRNAALAARQSSVSVTRDNIDYGRHGENDLRETYRGVLDVSGRISEHATYDAYYEYGRTDVAITKLNDTLSDRYAAALDVVTNPTTGPPVCRSNLGGANAACVPVSLWTGTDHAASACLLPGQRRQFCPDHATGRQRLGQRRFRRVLPAAGRPGAILVRRGISPREQCFRPK